MGTPLSAESLLQADVCHFYPPLSNVSTRFIVVMKIINYIIIEEPSFTLDEAVNDP